MLVYDVTSRVSFDRIFYYYKQVLKPMKPRHPPIMIVAVRTNAVYGISLVEEGLAFAELAACGFCELYEDDIEAIGTAFNDLVGAYWIYRFTEKDEWAWQARGRNPQAASPKLKPIQLQETPRTSKSSRKPAARKTRVRYKGSANNYLSGQGLDAIDEVEIDGR